MPSNKPYRYCYLFTCECLRRILTHPSEFTFYCIEQYIHFELVLVCEIQLYAILWSFLSADTVLFFTKKEKKINH